MVNNSMNNRETTHVNLFRQAYCEGFRGAFMLGVDVGIQYAVI